MEPKMSEETDRMIAHAVKSLAESVQGIGGVLRGEVASRLETNRILALIHDQNGEILKAIERGNERHRESEKAIRVLQSTVKNHGERIVTLEQATGIAPAE